MKSADDGAAGAPHILRRAAIAGLEGRQKVHFLNSNARRLNKSLGDATGITGFGFHLVEIPVGAESTEYHRHHHEDECVYVLAGTGVVTLDDVEHPVEAGDFIGLPAGGPAHVFYNPGPEALRMIVVGARLEFDVADYPRLGKRLYRHGQGWDLVDHEAVVDVRAGRPDVGAK